ncbi:MAG: phage shock protein C [Phenylobacterium sp.]|jgi:phage shock protein C
MNRTYESNTIYKDTMHKKLSGVCSGIARYYNKERWMIRAGALISLLIFPVATGIAYLVAAVLLPNRRY